MALKKSQIKPPVLPQETVEVPELGGEIVVRGLLLRERLVLFDDARGEDAARFGHLTQVLACCVVDAAGERIYSVDEWEQFGAVHFEAALRLFNVALRLSGLDVEAAKKN